MALSGGARNLFSRPFLSVDPKADDSEAQRGMRMGEVDRFGGKRGG